MCVKDELGSERPRLRYARQHPAGEAAGAGGGRVRRAGGEVGGSCAHAHRYSALVYKQAHAAPARARVLVCAAQRLQTSS